MVGFKGSAPHLDGGTMDEIRAISFLMLMFFAAMSPLLLLPLFLTDAQGRRWVKRRTFLYIFGILVFGVLVALVTINWHVVAPFAETSFAVLLSLLNVAKQLPGDLVDWFESGEGLYFFLKALMTFAIMALFCSRVLPLLQKRLVSFNARIKGVSVEPRSVNREEIAASRERQQRELQEKAREKDELSRQRRLAHASEEEQRLQRFGQGFGQGVGRYAR